MEEILEPSSLADKSHISGIRVGFKDYRGIIEELVSKKECCDCLKNSRSGESPLRGIPLVAGCSSDWNAPIFEDFT